MAVRATALRHDRTMDTSATTLTRLVLLLPLAAVRPVPSSYAAPVPSQC